MFVNEIFSSIQGEGPQVGKYVTFVRMAGCNLSCEFCDSKFAKDGIEVSNKAVVDAIIDRGIMNVVFTGGEPFMQLHDLMLVSQELRELEYHVAVETNGTYSKLDTNVFDLIVVSPKMMDDVDNWVDVRNAVLKFVVDQSNVVDVLRMIVDQELSGVYLMPKGVDVDDLMGNSMVILDTIRRYKLDAYLGLRLHIMMGLR